jgi:hypothetical protein
MAVIAVVAVSAAAVEGENLTHLDSEIREGVPVLGFLDWPEGFAAAGFVIVAGN